MKAENCKATNDRGEQFKHYCMAHHSYCLVVTTLDIFSIGTLTSRKRVGALVLVLKMWASPAYCINSIVCLIALICMMNIATLAIVTHLPDPLKHSSQIWINKLVFQGQVASLFIWAR